MLIKFDNSLQLKYINQFEVGDHCFRTMDFAPTCVQGFTRAHSKIETPAHNQTFDILFRFCLIFRVHIANRLVLESVFVEEKNNYEQSMSRITLPKIVEKNKLTVCLHLLITVLINLRKF